MDRVPQLKKESTRGLASLALLCGLADDLGRSSEALLEAAGLNREAISDSSGTVTAGQELAAIDALLADPDEAVELGLLAGSRYRVTTYGIWSYALLSSPTLRDAIEIGVSYIGLTYACTTISAEESSDAMWLRFDDWPIPEPLRRFVLARDTVAALGIVKGIFDATLVPLRAELALPPPRDREAFTAAFGPDLLFDCEASALFFEREILDREMPQASELTAQMCLAQCRELLEARDAHSGLSGKVRDLLLSDPRRMPGQEEVAARLNLSVRSLRRQLGEQDVSFRELVEQTRRGLAEDLLLTKGLTVDQVAYRVGYADTSAFVHAFRRWNGDAPRRWARRQLRPARPD